MCLRKATAFLLSFPASCVLQILGSEDNTFLLQARTGEQLRLRMGLGPNSPSRKVPKLEGRVRDSISAHPPGVLATHSILLSPCQQASLPSLPRAGPPQSQLEMFIMGMCYRKSLSARSHPCQRPVGRQAPHIPSRAVRSHLSRHVWGSAASPLHILVGCSFPHPGEGCE